MDSDLGVLSPDSFMNSARGQIVREGEGKLEAPENIVTGVAMLRSLYSQTYQQNIERTALLTAVEGQIAGNAPYDQEELDAQGLGYVTNVNSLSARARYKRKASAYWNLTNKVEYIARVSLDFFADEKQEVDPESIGQWEDILSEEFDRLLREWSGFEVMMGTNISQLVKFGLSVIFWNDERDWRPRVTELPRFLIPNQASTNPDLFTYCFFENDFTAQYLFETYERIKKLKGDKGKEGKDEYKHFWNLEALEQILLFRANSAVKSNNRFPNFYDLQISIQNGDYGVGQLFSDSVRIVTCFYREYDNKISHYMFDPVSDTSGNFAYFADRQYKNWQHCIGIFTATPGEFTIHSNKGLGQEIFSACQAKDQMVCRMIDMGGWAATPMLRNNNLNSYSDPQQIKLIPGVPTDINSAEFVQNNLGANIPGVVQLDQYLTQQLDVNIAYSGGDPAQPDRELGSISPSQARLQSYREMGLLEPEINHYYNQLDPNLRTIMCLVLRSKEGYPAYDEAARFKKRCLKRGVPEEIFKYAEKEDEKEMTLPDRLRLRASRVAGDGSTLGQIIGLETMQVIAGSFSPKQEAVFKRDWVRASMGPDGVRRYIDDAQRVDQVSNDGSVAGLENNSMRNGQTPLWSGENNHKTHFSIHLGMAKQLVDALSQQQADIVEVAKIFDVLIPHAAEHWNVLVKNPFAKGFISQNQKEWKQAVEYATLVKKNAYKAEQARAQQAQEEQAQTQQVMDEQQRKDYVVEREQGRKDQESGIKAQRQEQQSATRGEIQKTSIERDAENKRLKIQLDHNIKTQEVGNKATIEQAKANIEQFKGDTISPTDIEGV